MQVSQSGGAGTHGQHAQFTVTVDDDGRHGRARADSLVGGGLSEQNVHPFAIAYVTCVDRVKHVVTSQGSVPIRVPNTHAEAMASAYSQQWAAAEEKEQVGCGRGEGARDARGHGHVYTGAALDVAWK